MINAREALEIIRRSVQRLDPVTVSLATALHHVLAETIVAPGNIPPFDNAGMDGYAVRSEDVPIAPVTLTIVGSVMAGIVFPASVVRGECVAITTGSPIPDGCDAVVQSEWTERGIDPRVSILGNVSRGQNIRRAGSDLAEAAAVLSAGTRLRPQEIGILAAIGRQFVEVYRKPLVAILTTGNELLEIDQPLRAGMIRNSNDHLLRALVTELGCTVVDMGIARDEHADLAGRLKEGLTYDLLLTSGGVSVGEYDLVGDVLRSLGVDVRFWKVNIKPGMPLLFGTHGKTPVFGLPGNPVSTMITFLQFARPAISFLMGDGENNRLTLRAVLEEPVAKNDGKRHFVRGILSTREGELFVRTTGAQTSHMLSSLVKAECLIIIPEESTTIEAGSLVEVELL